MNWSEKDKKLFKIVNNFGKNHLEKQIEEASQKYFTLKITPPFYTIFGYYNNTNNVFCWENKMNELSYNTFKKHHINLFYSDSTIKNLFKPIVKFDSEYSYIIPYLMEAFNKNFNIVRIKSCNCYIYALTKVEGITKTFNYELFEEALINYKNKEYNKRKPNITKCGLKNVIECKEKLV